MTSYIIPLSFVLLNLESLERKGENYKSLNISGTKKSFLYEIKNIFHSFSMAIIWWKNKKIDKK